MDISGKSKAKILAGLYNNSKPLGMGITQFSPKEMGEDEAEKLLKERTYFDYLNGRVMKVDLSTDEIRTDSYNRDNGPGEAERVINAL